MAKRGFPLMVTEYLRGIGLDELQFLVKLAGDKQVGIFYKFLQAEAERRKNIIYVLPEHDPVKLAIEKSALRGGVEALSTIFDMIKASPLEMERRFNESKKAKENG